MSKRYTPVREEGEDGVTLRLAKVENRLRAGYFLVTILFLAAGLALGFGSAAVHWHFNPAAVAPATASTSTLGWSSTSTVVAATGCVIGDLTLNLTTIGPMRFLTLLGSITFNCTNDDEEYADTWLLPPETIAPNDLPFIDLDTTCVSVFPYCTLSEPCGPFDVLAYFSIFPEGSANILSSVVYNISASPMVGEEGEASIGIVSGNAVNLMDPYFTTVSPGPWVLECRVHWEAAAGNSVTTTSAAQQAAWKAKYKM